MEERLFVQREEWPAVTGPYPSGELGRGELAGQVQPTKRRAPNGVAQTVGSGVNQSPDLDGRHQIARARLKTTTWLPRGQILATAHGRISWGRFRIYTPTRDNRRGQSHEPSSRAAEQLSQRSGKNVQELLRVRYNLQKSEKTSGAFARTIQFPEI
jgi:hypothetical protein